jgi:hypothetical protein
MMAADSRRAFFKTSPRRKPSGPPRPETIDFKSPEAQAVGAAPSPNHPLQIARGASFEVAHLQSMSGSASVFLGDSLGWQSFQLNPTIARLALTHTPLPRGSEILTLPGWKIGQYGALRTKEHPDGMWVHA